MDEGMKLIRAEKVGWIITAVLTIACLVIPVQGLYTVQVKAFLAITVFCLTLAAFELIPNIAVALLLPALYIFFKAAPANVVMGPWIGSTPLMIAGAMFMASTLDASGLLKRIAYKLMCLAKGSYLAILVMVFVCGVVLNIITSGRGYVIIAPLAMGLCISLGAMKKHVGAGMAAAVMIGGCTSHAYTFQATAWANINNMAKGLADPVTPLSVIVHCWPLFFVSLFMVWIVSKVYKPEDELKDAFGNVTYFQEKLDTMGPITKRERNNAIMLVFLLTYVFTVSIHKLDVNMGFALIPWVVYLPFMKGADLKTFRTMNWDMVFFCMGCMAIGSVAGSLGLGDVIANVCLQVLGGSTNIFAILSIVFSIVLGLNFLMTPMAIFALITQPLLGLAASMGIAPEPILYTINACSEAILLPYEYVPYLVVYSFGMISMVDFIKFNIGRSIIFFGGFLAVLVPYWMLTGLL